MYTQRLGLKEKIAIVEDYFQIPKGAVEGQLTLIPDNNAEILVPIKENLTFKCIGCVRPTTLLAGKAYFLMPRRRGAIIPVSLRLNCFVIKINPIYAKKISDRLIEISNGVYDLGFSKEKLDELYKGLEYRDTYELSDRLENLLTGVTGLYDYNSTILDAIDLIKESSGTVSVKSIYSKLGVSKSKLEQHFNREVGLTPKEFCKIEKINCFISAYRDDEGLSLTELTYQCGYYDQSHLIKDFRYFLDRSPKEYFVDNH